MSDFMEEEEVVPVFLTRVKQEPDDSVVTENSFDDLFDASSVCHTFNIEDPEGEVDYIITTQDTDEFGDMEETVPTPVRSRVKKRKHKVIESPNTKVHVKRRRRCGQCGPCQVKENCGTCPQCLRRSVLKQSCIYRKCLYLRKPVRSEVIAQNVCLEDTRQYQPEQTVNGDILMPDDTAVLERPLVLLSPERRGSVSPGLERLPERTKSAEIASALPASPSASDNESAREIAYNQEEAPDNGACSEDFFRILHASVNEEPVDTVSKAEHQTTEDFPKPQGDLLKDKSMQRSLSTDQTLKEASASVSGVNSETIGSETSETVSLSGDSSSNARLEERKVVKGILEEISGQPDVLKSKKQSNLERLIQKVGHRKRQQSQNGAGRGSKTPPSNSNHAENRETMADFGQPTQCMRPPFPFPDMTGQRMPFNMPYGNGSLYNLTADNFSTHSSVQRNAQVMPPGYNHFPPPMLGEMFAPYPPGTANMRYNSPVGQFTPPSGPDVLRAATPLSNTDSHLPPTKGPGPRRHSYGSEGHLPGPQGQFPRQMTPPAVTSMQRFRLPEPVFYRHGIPAQFSPLPPRPDMCLHPGAPVQFRPPFEAPRLEQNPPRFDGYPHPTVPHPRMFSPWMPHGFSVNVPFPNYCAPVPPGFPVNFQQGTPAPLPPYVSRFPDPNGSANNKNQRREDLNPNFSATDYFRQLQHNAQPCSPEIETHNGKTMKDPHKHQINSHLKRYLDDVYMNSSCPPARPSSVPGETIRQLSDNSSLTDYEHEMISIDDFHVSAYIRADGTNSVEIEFDQSSIVEDHQNQSPVPSELTSVSRRQSNTSQAHTKDQVTKLNKCEEIIIRGKSFKVGLKGPVEGSVVLKQDLGDEGVIQMEIPGLKFTVENVRLEPNLISASSNVEELLKFVTRQEKTVSEDEMVA